MASNGADSTRGLAIVERRGYKRGRQREEELGVEIIAGIIERVRET